MKMDVVNYPTNTTTHSSQIPQIPGQGALNDLQNHMVSDDNKDDTLEVLRRLFHDIPNCTVENSTSLFKINYPTIKAFLSRTNIEEPLIPLKSQCFEFIESYMSIEIAEVTRELVSICLSTVLESDLWDEICLRLLKVLLVEPKHYVNLPQIGHVFEAIIRLLTYYPNVNEKDLPKLTLFTNILESFIVSPLYLKSFAPVLTILAKILGDNKNNVGSEAPMDYSSETSLGKCHLALVRLACLSLRLYNSNNITSYLNYYSFMNDTFTQLMKLLANSKSHPIRVSLFTSMGIFAKAGMNKNYIKSIIEEDVLTTHSSLYTNDPALSAGVLTVFIECLRKLDGVSFTHLVFDKILGLINEFWLTEDNHVRERCFTMALVLINTFEKYGSVFNTEYTEKAQRFTSIMFFVSSNRIQELKLPREKWNSMEHIIHLKSTIQVYIEILLSSTRVLSEITLTSNSNDEKYKRTNSGNKRGITYIESLEICKVFCSLLEISSNANTVRHECLHVTGNEVYLQEYEIKEIVKSAVKLFMTSFKPTLLHQWFKLVLPIVFSMTLSDKFLLCVFECFNTDYCDLFVQHYLSFLMILLNLEGSAVDYMRRVVEYSKGTIGYIGCDPWDTDDPLLSLSDSDIQDLAMLDHIFLLLPHNTEAMKSCHNEVGDLVRALFALPLDRTCNILKMSVKLFKNINKANNSNLIYEPLSSAIGELTNKILLNRDGVHTDWIELLFVISISGPFKGEFISKCVKPVLSILFSRNTKLATVALELLESWAENVPIDALYKLLSLELVSNTLHVRPHFIQLLTSFLTDDTAENYSTNAKIASLILSKLGAYSLNFVCDLPLDKIYNPRIALPICFDNNEPGKFLTMPVSDGLNSVIRVLSKSSVSLMEFEAASGFVLSTLSPLMDYTVSLSECWLSLISSNNHGMPKFIPTSDGDEHEFIKLLTTAFVKVLAKGRVFSNDSPNELYSDLLSLRFALINYLTIVYQSHNGTTAETCLDPSLFIEAISSRLLHVEIDEESKFSSEIQDRYIDPLECDVASDLLVDLYKLGSKAGANSLNTVIINTLCLSCSSKNVLKRAGSCKSLKRLCSCNNTEFIRQFLPEIARSLLELGDTKYYYFLFDVLPLLIKIDEDEMCKFALSLLKHRSRKVRNVSIFCLKQLPERFLNDCLQQAQAVASEYNYPDVLLYSCKLNQNYNPFVEKGMRNLIKDLQSCDDDDFPLVLALFKDILTVGSDGLDEDTVDLLLVCLLKLMITGTDSRTAQVETLLSEVDVVQPKVISNALETFIIQLQTILDYNSLKKIMRVVEMYKSVIDSNLVESLYNIAKSIIEGQLYSYSSSEYRTVQLVEYIKFLMGLGKSKSCLDLIFENWFDSLHTNESTLVIPGSIAYNVWGIFESSGNIHNILERLMRGSAINFVCFAKDANLKHVISSVSTLLANSNYHETFQLLYLIHWLVDGHFDLISTRELKNITKSLVTLANSNQMYLENFVKTLNCTLDDILNVKISSVSFYIVLELSDKTNIDLNQLDIMKQYSDDDFDKSLFMSATSSLLYGTKEYRLRRMISMSKCSDMEFRNLNIQDEIFELGWDLALEGTPLNRIYAIYILSRAITAYNVEYMGVCTVFSRFVDIVSSYETINLLDKRGVSSLDVIECDIYSLICTISSNLVSRLSNISTPSDAWSELGLEVDRETTYPIWLWILMRKVKGCDKELLTPILGSLILHLNVAFEMVLPVLRDMLTYISGLLENSSSNWRRDHLDLHFGTLVLFDCMNFEEEEGLVTSSSVKLLLLPVAYGNATVQNVLKYEDVAIKRIYKLQPFLTINRILKSLPLLNLKRELKLSDHFIGGTMVLGSDVNKSDYKKMFLTLRMQKNSTTEYHSEMQQRGYYKAAIVTLRLINRLLDFISQNDLNLLHVKSILSKLWPIRYPPVAKEFQKCLSKLSTLYLDDFGDDSEFLNWVKISIADEIKSITLRNDTTKGTHHSDSLDGEFDLNKMQSQNSGSSSFTTSITSSSVTSSSDNLKVESCFSTAIRTFITLLRVTTGNKELLKSMIQGLLPQFLLSIVSILNWNVENLKEFPKGNLRVQNCLWSLPPSDNTCNMIQVDTGLLIEYDGGKRLDQLLTLIVHSLPLLDPKSQSLFYNLLNLLTWNSSHPYNICLIDKLSFIFSNCSPNTMDVDSDETTPASVTDDRNGYSRRESPRHWKKDPLSPPPLRIPVLTQSSFNVEMQLDSMANLYDYDKNLLKLGNELPPADITLKEYDLQLRRRNKFKFATFNNLLCATSAIVKEHVKSSSANDDIVYNILYSLRNLSRHPTLAKEFNEFYYRSLKDDVSNRCPHGGNRPIRDKLIAYSSCVSTVYDQFLEFNQTRYHDGIYTTLSTIFKSDITLDDDNYTSLLLDSVYPFFNEDYELGINKNYPKLPSLRPQRREINSQLDFICDDSNSGLFKEGILILTDFKKLGGQSEAVVQDVDEKPRSIEYVEEDATKIKEPLEAIYRYNISYVNRYVKCGYLALALRKLWHVDEDFGVDLWVNIFPQLYSMLPESRQLELSTLLSIYLCKNEHVYNKRPICRVILMGAIKCYPPMNIAPEILKHMAFNFRCWFECAYYLEKQILSQPLDITRIATVLSDLWDKLNYNDLMIGSARTWIITQETRLAISYLQHSKWKQAQREFNSIMESLAIAGQTAETVSNFDESKVWYNGWVQCTKQLAEWDHIRDVAYAAADQKLFVQASSALQDWTGTDDSVWRTEPLPWCLDNAEYILNKINYKFHSAIAPFKNASNNTHPWLFVHETRQLDKLIQDGRQSVLESWRRLPDGLCNAHELPVQLGQRYLEVDEGVKFVTRSLFNLYKGTPIDESNIVNKWRRRLPRKSDKPSVWNELLTWRSLAFSSIKSVLLNNLVLAKDTKPNVIATIQDYPWTLVKFASIARKSHQLPLMSSVLLNKAQKFLLSFSKNVIGEDYYAITIERLKQYLSFPMNIPDALKNIITLDIDKLPSKGFETLKAHVIRLKTEAINRSSNFDNIKRQFSPGTHSSDLDVTCKYMLEALKLQPLLSKGWVTWAKFNDNKIDRTNMSQWKANSDSVPKELFESAIMAYLTSISIRPELHWLLIKRVLSLLNEMHMGGLVSESFKRYSEQVPVSVWLLWLPQLVTWLYNVDSLEIQHLLLSMMEKCPQQVFYSIRCEYLAQMLQNESEDSLIISRVLISLISSNPTVGSVLETFATTLTQLGKPDLLDEILCASETIFEECLDLPFNEKIPLSMFNCLVTKMPKRCQMYDEGDYVDPEIISLMNEFGNDFKSDSGTLTCGETMNKLLKWIKRLNTLPVSANYSSIQQQLHHLRVHEDFCRGLRRMDFPLELPTLQPSRCLLNPKRRYCLGEVREIVSISPKITKRRRRNHIIKSIHILTSDGQKHAFSLHPLTLQKQKSEQHVAQMIKLINSYVLKYNETRRRNITLTATNIVPLDPYVCLLEDEYNDITLSTIFSSAISFNNLLKTDGKAHCDKAGMNFVSKETNLLLLVLHKMLLERNVTKKLCECWSNYNSTNVEELSFTQIYQLFKDKQYPWFATWYKKIHQDVLQDAYNQLCDIVPDDILTCYTMNQYQDYQSFISFRTKFTSSYASQAVLNLMFSTPYATPCKISLNFKSGIVKQFDFRINYSKDFFIEYSKLRVFRLTRNIKNLIGSVCRLGTLPAVMYSLCACIHNFKLDIHSALTEIFNDEFIFNSEENSQDNNPTAKKDVNPLDEYISRILNYCSYLRSPSDQEHCSVPINNIITCIIDASTDSAMLGKLKTGYQPWF